MTRLLTTCAAIIGLSCLATASQAQNSDQFGQALGQMGIGEPVMTYTCRLWGNQVLGLPVIIGREQFRTVSISIGEEAAASVNGTVIEPVHIKHADNGEDISGVVYDAREFQQAMAGPYRPKCLGCPVRTSRPSNA